MIKLKDLIKILEENKAKNICVYDLSSKDEQSVLVIVSAAKIADSKHLADVLCEKFDYQEKIEGYFKGEWIVFDFSKISLHIFLPKIREKYNLDKMHKASRISV